MASQHGRTAATGPQSGKGGAADAVRQVVAPAVDAAGLFLEGVVVTRAGKRSVVRITVDLPEDAVGSLDSDTLGDVARAISAALDADDVVRGAYTLETSTPGTSRPLTELRHFRRARGRLVTLQRHDGGQTSGRLADVTAGSGGEGEDGGPWLVLEDGTRVAVADVRTGRIDVELKRLDETPDQTDATGDARNDETTGSARHDDTGSARHQEG